VTGWESTDADSAGSAYVSQAEHALLVGRRDGTIVHASDAFCRLLGRSVEEILGRSATAIGLTNDSEERWVLDRLPPSGQGYRYLREIETVRGRRLVEVEVHGVSVGEELVVATYREATPDIASPSDAHVMGVVIDQAPVGIVVYDRDLRILHVNGAAERTGRVTPKHLGLRLMDAFPEVSPTLPAAIRNVFETGEAVVNVEAGGVDERSSLLNTFPIRDPANNVALVGCVFSDVTDRTAAERLTRELAAIVMSSDDAILSKDLDGTIRSWNAGAERLYGITAAEAIGEPITIIEPDHLQGETHAILSRVATGERVEHYETARRRKDGTMVEVSLSVSPIRDGDGHVTAASVIARDVTQRREAERALVESEGHRRGILASLLQAEEQERSRIATELHDDTVQVMTAGLLVMDRVAMAARKSGSPDLESAIVLARATLEEATDRARRLMFELRPAILHEQGLTAALRVLADQTAREALAQANVECHLGRYEHAIEELVYRTAQEALANVRKHADPETITIEVQEEGGALIGEIRDDGRGFDMVGVKSRPEAALHLGLDSLVERVRAAGGDLTIDSKPGAGTQVRFSVPLHANRSHAGW
jgi:PAS domain S-box-containing protein